MLSNEEIEYNKAFFGEETAPEPAEEIEEFKEHVETQEEVEEQPEETATEPVEEQEQPQEVEEDKQEEVEEEAQQVDKFVINWNGKEIEVTKEEAIKLAQQGFDYTFKTQSISKYKKQFEAMEQAGITESDLEVLKRIKSGDKEALAFLTKNAGVDPYDLLSIENPKVTLQNESDAIVISPQVKPLMEQIANNSELLAKLQQVEDVLPDAVIRAMAQSPELFYGVVSEVQNGTFYDVMPQLQKRLATMSDLDRAFVVQNPNQFATLYMDVKNTAKQVSTPPKQIIKQEREMPNMAEVGIKKSTVQARQEEVLKDAFNSDDEYQRILNKLKNQG